MYAKCGALAKAKEVFDHLAVRDVVSWNALIAGYVDLDHGREALNCFERMHNDGISPSVITYICIAKACGRIGAVHKGQEIHADIVKKGLLGKDIMLSTALVDMYAKCGALAKALYVFDELPVRDIFLWNTVIAAFAQHGCINEALNCVRWMKEDGLFPDEVTFTNILKACGSVENPEKGLQIHENIAGLGLLEKSITLGNALVDMYAKCGELTKAESVFDELSVRDVVAWSSLMAGYVQHGHGDKALRCFEQMEDEGLSPDTVAFGCILKACASEGEAKKGEEIHAEVVRKGLLEGNIILGTAVVDMYVRCGQPAKAQEVFDELPTRDAVTWSALIAGYAHHGNGDMALNCLKRMLDEGLFPDIVSYTCILKACGSMAAIGKGEEIHSEVVRLGLLETNNVLGTALVDMYAKCGELPKAQGMFDELPIRDIVTWSALMAGYGQNGHTDEALICFQRMQQVGLSPNAVTFTCLLNACSHSGLMEEGLRCYTTMSMGYAIIPTAEHQACMVDLLGRAGHLDTAIGVIERTLPSDLFPVWSSLLGACRKWGNAMVGRLAFEHMVQLDEKFADAYVCMSDIYESIGMLNEAGMVEAMRLDNGAHKMMGMLQLYMD